MRQLICPYVGFIIAVGEPAKQLRRRIMDSTSDACNPCYIGSYPAIAVFRPVCVLVKTKQNVLLNHLPGLVLLLGLFS